LPEEWKDWIIVPIYKKGDKKIVVIVKVHQITKYVYKFIQNPAVKVNFTCGENYWVSSMGI
jgi:hypothetical protein